MNIYEDIAREAVSYLEKLPLGHEQMAAVRQMREALIVASRK
jgi:hypothetical protein